MKKKRKSHYQRGAYVSSKSNVEYQFRSGWEQAYMKWLDENQAVVAWSYETIIIEYVSNKKTLKRRKYIPDFLVEYIDHSELIEIKPASRVDQARVQKKLAAARGWCEARNIVLQVLTEHELKALGLLGKSTIEK